MQINTHKESWIKKKLNCEVSVPVKFSISIVIPGHNEVIPSDHLKWAQSHRAHLQNHIHYYQQVPEVQQNFHWPALYVGDAEWSPQWVNLHKRWSVFSAFRNWNTKRTENEAGALLIRLSRSVNVGCWNWCTGCMSLVCATADEELFYITE